MAQTPEGKVKAGVKKVLNEWDPKPFYYMPVQNGMGVVGIPDIIGCYRSRFFAIETKKPNKTPTTSDQRVKKCTPNQLNRIKEIMSADGFVIVCDDPSQVVQLLKAMDEVIDDA